MNMAARIRRLESPLYPLCLDQQLVVIVRDNQFTEGKVEYSGCGRIRPAE